MTSAGLPAACLLAAAPRVADLAALVLLLAFTWWGARKGAWRQALSLAVLAAAFHAAGRFAGAFAPTIAKLFDLSPAPRQALAWAAVLFAGLVLGALLIRLLAGGLRERSHPGADRVLGGLLGALKGAVVLTLVGYLALGTGGAAPPALSRPAGGAAAPGASTGLVARVRGSLGAVCLQEWGGLLRRVVTVPPWVAERMDRVDRALDGPLPEAVPGARPRGR